MISPNAHIYGNLKCGKGCRIDDGCILTGDIELGDYVHLAPYCVLHGKSGIKIGDYSGFSAFTVMHTQSDDFTGRSMFGPCVPEEYKPYLKKGGIIIGRCVIFGSRVTVLPGVRVEDGVSVGAHSLIKSDCLADTIYAGCPAKAIGRRELDIWNLVMNFELGIDP